MTSFSGQPSFSCFSCFFKFFHPRTRGWTTICHHSRVKWQWHLPSFLLHHCTRGTGYTKQPYWRWPFTQSITFTTSYSCLYPSSDPIRTCHLPLSLVPSTRSHVDPMHLVWSWNLFLLRKSGTYNTQLQCLLLRPTTLRPPLTVLFNMQAIRTHFHYMQHFPVPSLNLFQVWNPWKFSGG